MRNDAEEYRRWERRCLEQAKLCQRPDARTAYLSLAPNYRIAAAKIEAQTASSVWSKIWKTPAVGWRAWQRGKSRPLMTAGVEAGQVRPSFWCLKLASRIKKHPGEARRFTLAGWRANTFGGDLHKNRNAFGFRVCLVPDMSGWILLTNVRPLPLWISIFTDTIPSRYIS